MAEIRRAAEVKAGAWRTLEHGWDVALACRFSSPAGAQIRVRYGAGWGLGWNSQKQTLDGKTGTVLQVGGDSVLYARVQMKVPSDSEVTYACLTTV